VDFPDLGIAQAANEGDVLTVETYAGTTAAAGQPTHFRIVNLPSTGGGDSDGGGGGGGGGGGRGRGRDTHGGSNYSPVVVCDGQVHSAWSMDTAAGALTIYTTFAAHLFTVQTGTATTATKL
jgi:hypothetical protein